MVSFFIHIGLFPVFFLSLTGSLFRCYCISPVLSWQSVALLISWSSHSLSEYGAVASCCSCLSFSHRILHRCYLRFLSRLLVNSAICQKWCEFIFPDPLHLDLKLFYLCIKISAEDNSSASNTCYTIIGQWRVWEVLGTYQVGSYHMEWGCAFPFPSFSHLGTPANLAS